MKTRKPKPENLLDQLSAPMKDFVMDFKAHGGTVLRQVREKNPEKYLELSTKLASLVAALKPEADESFAKSRSMEEIAQKLLLSIGMTEEAITADCIKSAVEANNRFVATLEQIAASEDDSGIH